MATAEFAVAMPCVIVALVMALSALSTATDQIRCTDAARATARLLARGDSPGSAVAHGRALAPVNAVVTVSGSTAQVQVRVVGRAALGLAWLGSRAAPSSVAVAAREDSVGVSPTERP